ncbi:hypothetical protein GUITHDRAFT_102443 [Guillardia theta CCMP2712]|uniref:Dol-P-Glc:Glc(2)Man(9)GlcNAc(2)-PP-Dol alpha-1,2-glucosyltransferase n=1 Tax=Guillardia theta (strain CCMP2712) TaxID=905079 RepID=L1JTV4_GUITC|nr:hypothetical protein GUITHDRAFT_102443 [Guillardia theta CCMP2712]EKX51832.1 hypothetical protein GUITHDRAFT_102443 [Guillardia theta CCMP2712]|eukprot:XP_005838812.1 hypothetical protein GUITHDRAFT_102443 [Guillardia theta CCMP2712]
MAVEAMAMAMAGMMAGKMMMTTNSFCSLVMIIPLTLLPSVGKFCVADRDSQRQNVEPYMDEGRVFFLGSQDLDVAGKWLPGLYWMSLALLPASNAFTSLLRSLRWLELEPSKATSSGLLPGLGCDVEELRTFNLFVGVLTAGVVCMLVKRVNGSHDLSRGSTLLRWVAVVIFFPVQFSSYFLFYTDAIATLMTLVTYERLLARRTLQAAMSGALAIFCRQTCVIWTGFGLGVLVLQEFGSTQEDNKNLLEEVISIIRLLCVWKNLRRVLAHSLPLLLVLLGFLVFVYKNGGFAVGDKWLASSPRLDPHLAFGRSNHEVGLHPMQAYNRHYVFYIWKNVFRSRTWPRYALAPFYMYSVSADEFSPTVTSEGIEQVYSTYSLLRCRRSSVWVTWFLFCSVLTVIPTGLLEPRYFIIPVTFLLIHLPPDDQGAGGRRAQKGEQTRRDMPAWLTLAAYTLVNAVYLYVFLFRTFRWPDGSVARFMW